MWIINKKFILGLLVFLIVFQFFIIRIFWVQVNLQWLDIPMHFLGGALVASILFAFLKENDQLFSWSKNNFVNLILTVSFVALIGVLWEFYEYLYINYFLNEIMKYNVIPIELGDTLKDLFFDLVGGFLAAGYYFWNRARKDL